MVNSFRSDFDPGNEKLAIPERLFQSYVDFATRAIQNGAIKPPIEGQSSQDAWEYFAMKATAGEVIAYLARANRDTSINWPKGMKEKLEQLLNQLPE